MTESPQSLKQSVGTPFWIGFVVGPILLFTFFGIPNVSGDSRAFWSFAAFALLVLGPIGGVIFQVVYDINIAIRARLFRVRDYAVFVAMVVALVAAGIGLFHGSRRDLAHPFNSPVFEMAFVFIVLLLSVYALWNWIACFPPGQPSRVGLYSRARPSLAQQLAGGAFCCLCFVELIRNLFNFVTSFAAGRSLWLMLVESVVLEGGGVALGLALAMGNLAALRVVRFWLLLTVSAGLLGIAASALHLPVWSKQNWMATTDVVVSIALLILISRERKPSP